jgi:hypothetical protein
VRDPSQPRARKARASVREAIYARADTRFAKASLCKPLEGGGEGLPRALAPLFLFEVEDEPDEAMSASCARPGPLFPGLNIILQGEGKPVVHAALDEVFLSGQPRPRLSYLWLQPQPTENGQRVFTTQGVRLILDNARKPAITEVVRDTTEARILYVNASLEAAAAAAHGPPLEGRKFSVERSLAETSDTVVGRVLEDGPVPMGPILYVKASTADLATVICRCMPSQVQAVFRSEDYELIELDPALPADSRAIASMSRGLAAADLNDLERRLRLPPAF